jgi:hypothetical protein
MIVDDLHIISVSVSPSEADSPLIIDPDTIGSGSIPLQLFEAIVRRNSQIVQPEGPMQIEQFPSSDALDRLKPAHRLVLKQPLRIGATEGPDQTIKLMTR